MSRDMLLIPLGGSGGSEPGAQGVQGVQGVQGIEGYQGAEGTQGTAGADGNDGVQGIQGIQGFQGASGADGVSERLDVSQLSQAELVSFYSNYATEMATKDLYWGVYPVTSIRNYEVNNVTCLTLTYQLEATQDPTTGEPIVKTRVAVVAPNGTVPYNSDTTVTLVDSTSFATSLQGKQDTLTAGEGISIQGTTISATGGGAKQWFGTQAQFQSLQSVDMDTDYYISDPIDYSEIANTPAIPEVPTRMSQLANDEGFVTHHQMDNYVNAHTIMKIVNGHNWYGTQAEYEALQSVNPDTNYFIEGDEVSLQMTFTFTDSTQAVYDVYIKPTV